MVMIKIIGFLVILVIIIVFFGLLGMVVFIMEMCFKEISIWKIMGVMECGLVMLLSCGFFSLLLVVVVIGFLFIYFLFD